MSKTKFDFNHSLLELESIVQQMEAGDLNLDQALKQYEQGIKLVRACQASLEQAEQKIYQLSQEGKKQEINANDF